MPTGSVCSQDHYLILHSKGLPHTYRSFEDHILDDPILTPAARKVGRLWCQMVGEVACSYVFLEHWRTIPGKDIRLREGDDLPSAEFLLAHSSEDHQVSTIRIALLADIGYLKGGAHTALNTLEERLGYRLHDDALIAACLGIAYGEIGPDLCDYIDFVYAGQMTITDVASILDCPGCCA